MKLKNIRGYYKVFVMRKALVGSWVGTTEKYDKMADNPEVVFPAK